MRCQDNGKNGLLERAHGFMNIAPEVPCGKNFGVSASLGDEILVDASDRVCGLG